MHNRIDDCFARLFSERRKGFIPYICAGYPTLKRTVDLAFALEKAGADMLELGLPFSDPLADGVVNQLAAQRSLAVARLSAVFSIASARSATSRKSQSFSTVISTRSSNSAPINFIARPKPQVLTGYSFSIFRLKRIP